MLSPPLRLWRARQGLSGGEKRCTGNRTVSSNLTPSAHAIYRKFYSPMKSFDRLVKVIAKLRSPQGCPWDRKQTHASLIRYLFEEAKELKSSIRKKDYKNLQEELGDVLLQVVLHSQLAREKGRFSIQDVIEDQIRKLTLRHPHVFGYTAAHRRALKGKKLKTSRDIVLNWDALKALSKR
jgi:tetrapyrrole methylase family protein / MazG family protein